MRKHSERIEELNVRRLTIHPEALRLPMRSEDSDGSRALRESLREQGLLQPLDVDEADRVLDGRERFRGARALGWKKILCRRVPPSRVAAVLGEARLSSPQYGQGQRALLIVAQHWPIFADRKERRLNNLKQSRAPTPIALGSEERATVAKLVQRLKINGESLRQAARLWEEKQDRAKSLIQGVVDGALSLGNAYFEFTHNGKKVKRTVPRLRQWLRQAAGCLAEFSEITQSEERTKISANLLQVRGQIERTLAASPQATRSVAANGFAHRNTASEKTVERMKVAFACLALIFGPWSVQAATNAASATIKGVTAEAQYRPGVDAGRFPLMEVYLANQTDKPIEWKRAFLNGNEVKGMTNGVVWTQFYPTSLAKPGETVLLQINTVQNPTVQQTIEAETEDGKRISAQLGPFKIPYTQITGVTFSWDFRRVFVAYFSMIRGQTPVQVVINGKDCTKNMRLMERPSGHLASVNDENPGMFAVDLPEPVKQGLPIHLRLEFRKDKTVQCLVRASRGIFLNASGVEEKNEKLRKELGLDLRPSAKMLGADPACDDLKAGKQYGRSMAAILEARKKLYAFASDLLSYIYLCTAATPNAAYSIYGQCCDACQFNPYQLQWSQDPKFIESEELFFHWGWQAARPRPWYWIPETFSKERKKGEWTKETIILEAPSLRLLTYAALARGCKGIEYFDYGILGKTVHGDVIGFVNSPPLLEAIKELNAEIKKLEPIWSAAIPLSVETIGSKENGIRVYTLASGDEGLLVVVRNLDYTTDRKPNQMGAAPRFRYVAKDKVKIRIRKPEWLNMNSVINPLIFDKKPLIFDKKSFSNEEILDALNQKIEPNTTIMKSGIDYSHTLENQDIPFEDKFDFLELNIGHLSLIKVVWIKNLKARTTDKL